MADHARKRAVPLPQQIAYTPNAKRLRVCQTGPDHVRCRSLAFIALAVSATTVALAQTGGTTKPAQGGSQQPPPATFRTEANFVRVDVYPTQNGVPVQDLKAEDF